MRKARTKGLAPFKKETQTGTQERQRERKREARTHRHRKTGWGQLRKRLGRKRLRLQNRGSRGRGWKDTVGAQLAAGVRRGNRPYPPSASLPLPRPSVACDPPPPCPRGGDHVPCRQEGSVRSLGSGSEGQRIAIQNEMGAYGGGTPPSGAGKAGVRGNGGRTRVLWCGRAVCARDPQRKKKRFIPTAQRHSPGSTSNKWKWD